MVDIKRITSTSQVALGDINALLLQLRHDASEKLGSMDELEAIVPNPNVIFVVAQDNQKTIGMGTVYLAQKFGKKTGFVEDVVVNEQYRGQGLGQKVMETLIGEANKAHASQLYLTSRPDRVAGNKLYQKLGFEQKETNVYLLKL